MDVDPDLKWAALAALIFLWALGTIVFDDGNIFNWKDEYVMDGDNITIVQKDVTYLKNGSCPDYACWTLVDKPYKPNSSGGT